MHSQPVAHRLWKAIAIAGTCLLAVGIGAGYLDDLTHYEFEFISNHYDDIIGPIGFIGLLLAFVGCIGWATYLGRQNRRRMALTVFIAPWAILLLGYPISGINIHGYSALVMLLIFPATLLGIVLGIMAVRKPREDA
jgi:hypothetical protein